MTNPVQPINVSLDIGLDTVIGAGYSDCGPDGYEVNGPVTLLDAIVTEAARMLVAKVVSDNEAWNPLRSRITEIRTQIIRELVQPKVEAALLAEGTKADEFSANVPSLREQIIREVRQCLMASRDGRGGFSDSTYTRALQATAEKVIAAELKDEIDKAKADMRAAVGKSVSAVLTDQIAKELGLK